MAENKNIRPPRQYRKPWFKWWSREWLEGSMRFECTPEERSVWPDLLAMGNESRNRGVIQANNGMAYPHSWLANKLCISLELLEVCLSKFTAQERIEENGTGITILNFEWYQDPEMDGFRGRGRPSRKTKGGKGLAPERLLRDTED